MAITERQQRIQEFIRAFTAREGHGPSYRDIAQGCGCSVSTAHREVAHLEGDGIIRLGGAAGGRISARTIALSESAPESAPAHAVPLVGEVCAGDGAIPEEMIESRISVPYQADYLLKVRGDSMAGAGILDGDLIAVSRDQVVRNGDICVALVEGESMVKHLYREPGAVELRPATDGYDAIRRGEDAVEIAGRVVGVMRSL